MRICGAKGIVPCVHALQHVAECLVCAIAYAYSKDHIFTIIDRACMLVDRLQSSWAPLSTKRSRSCSS